MSLGEVTQDFPFDNKTMVFRYRDKIFALVNIESWYNDQASVNLKNTPEQNMMLRESYASIVPGYHMNKKHWNTLHLYEGEISKDHLYEMTSISYTIVKQNFKHK